MAVLRASIHIAVVLALLMGAIAARVVSSARSELKAADELLGVGDLDGAIEQYRRAARWYAPGSPYHVTALEQLAVLGEQAEQRGDSERALAAYRAIRAAILSARSFYTPEAKRLKAVDGQIAALMASLPAPASDGGKSRQNLYREHLALLETRPGPRVLWSSSALVGFVMWVGAAYAFSAVAIDADGRLVWRQARRWGTLIVLGLGLFVLGLALA
jgi:tetratricopeptide (TPR) repeat protein